MCFGISRHYSYLKFNVEDMRIIDNQVDAVNVRMRVNSVHENVIDSRELESRCITVPHLPFDIILMDHKPLLRHQHVHHSRTTINDLITSYYHTIPEPEPQIIPLLLCIGFQHISLIKQCKIDPTLITALRPETHTFHFPWGECTITLEDFALHLGIRVDGRVVTRPSFLHWDELCHELLGKVPPENARKGAALKLTWLLSMLRASLPEEPIMHQLQCRCRAYIMYMIDGALILDKSGNRVHLMYLNLLCDLNNTKKYTNLYRELCRASSEVGKVVGSCVILLQSWAWYRMPFIAPRVRRPKTTFPLAKSLFTYSEIWSGGRLEYRATPHGDLVRYRSRIDHMESHEFSWVPYKGFEEHLPRCAYRDMEIWSACIAIICFSIVEWHQTNRVKLQFGLQQDIPVDPMNLDLLHKIYMRGNHYIDWIEYHAEWINIWKNKRSDVLAG
ncbi:Serine/threonine-protein phosphatase 7 long form [Glycine max]|nr:Serine/threonine-protein phosphatase 7 long form [Glycine max]